MADSLKIIQDNLFQILAILQMGVGVVVILLPWCLCGNSRAPFLFFISLLLVLVLSLFLSLFCYVLPYDYLIDLNSCTLISSTPALETYFGLEEMDGQSDRRDWLLF